MSLDQIALRTGTDKSSRHHNYTPTYEKYLGHLRNEPIVLIEGGWGGYEYYSRGGESARMWREYFPKGSINVFDIHDKKPIEGINFFKGSQDDGLFLNNLVSLTGHPDIVIDDASHTSSLCVRMFEILFPVLKKGGTYVIEDTHCSYWDRYHYGGGWHEGTTMNYFKKLADDLNYEHNGLTNKFEITSIHFYPKMIFIFK